MIRFTDYQKKVLLEAVAKYEARKAREQAESDLRITNNEDTESFCRKKSDENRN